MSVILGFGIGCVVIISSFKMLLLTVPRLRNGSLGFSLGGQRDQSDFVDRIYRLPTDLSNLLSTRNGD